MNISHATVELRLAHHSKTPNAPASLEYRCLELKIDNWGNLRGVQTWSDWKPVPSVVVD